MGIATSSVEFIFSDVTYRQINGVAMGFPLVPSLVNIFVGSLKKVLFSNLPKPVVYYRYVDGTFVRFNAESEREIFFNAPHFRLPRIAVHRRKGEQWLSTVS